MNLTSALSGVTGYAHRLGRGQAAQQHLQQVRRDPPPETPLGLRLLVSGSGQSLPIVPWIAFLDPDVTTTATRGLYLVYLYDASISRVSLSMNQGATQHQQNAQEAGLRGVSADRQAIEEIAHETAAIRASLGASLLTGTTATISLGGPTFLPRAYEAGNIAAITYPLGSLPSNEQLAENLQTFAALYVRCVEIKVSLAADQQVRTSARSDRNRKKPPQTPQFKPKDSADYLANVAAATQRRERKHEALVAEFGKAVIATGRSVATNVHPRDMTIDDEKIHWLVEAKTVGVNAEPAVRAAIGQLFAYRHFFYREKHKPDP